MNTPTVVGTALFGTVAFVLHDTVADTLAALAARPYNDVASAWRVIANRNTAPDANDDPYAVVGDALEAAWYTEQGKELPVAVKKKTPPAAAPAAKRTAAPLAAANRGVAAAIRDGVGRGLDDAQIFAELQPRFPTLRLGTVRYYRAHPKVTVVKNHAPVPAPEPPVPDSTDPAQLSALAADAATVPDAATTTSGLPGVV